MREEKKKHRFTCARAMLRESNAARERILSACDLESEGMAEQMLNGVYILLTHLARTSVCSAEAHQEAPAGSHSPTREPRLQTDRGSNWKTV